MARLTESVIENSTLNWLDDLDAKPRFSTAFLDRTSRDCDTEFASLLNCGGFCCIVIVVQVLRGQVGWLRKITDFYVLIPIHFVVIFFGER